MTCQLKQYHIKCPALLKLLNPFESENSLPFVLPMLPLDVTARRWIYLSFDSYFYLFRLEE